MRTVEELFRAADSAPAGASILVADGQYAMPRYLELRTEGLTLRSESGDRGKVVLDGASSRHGEILGVAECAGVTVADLTIQNARTNAFKINSDRRATRVTLRNCVVRNAWQRAVKGPAAGEAPRPSDCRIEYCLFYNDRPKRFEDDPTDTAATYGGNYVGGIDAMDARRWVIRDNVFVGIHGRTGEGRGAVFLWVESQDCVVERNVIIDCDAGICLGNSYKPDTVEAHARGCVVRNNFVTRCPEGGVVAAYTRECCVVHNTVYEPRSRFRRLVRAAHDNDGLVIANNLLGGADVLVESARGVRVSGNVTAELAALCADAESGDLHLRGRDARVVGAAAAGGGEVTEDFDGQRRDARPDVGADEIGD